MGLRRRGWGWGEWDRDKEMGLGKRGWGEEDGAGEKRMRLRKGGCGSGKGAGEKGMKLRKRGCGSGKGDQPLSSPCGSGNFVAAPLKPLRAASHRGISAPGWC